jgi:hypothetical protein
MLRSSVKGLARLIVDQKVKVRILTEVPRIKDGFRKIYQATNFQFVVADKLHPV